MIPLLPIAAGLIAFALGSLLLRAYGPRARVGRLLAVTPRVSVGEARRLATEGHARYVRVDGRVDAEEEFPDEQDRPLVLRRTRLDAWRNRAWRGLDERRTFVEFDVRQDLDAIAIDAEAVGDGLVVVPRESVGTAGDAQAELPVDLPPATRVRFRVEQVSSVDHATVLGVPRLDGTGRPWMTAGTGRPLVVCTLDSDEAMRVLAGGDRRRPVVAAGLLAGGLALLAVGLGWAIVAGHVA